MYTHTRLFIFKKTPSPSTPLRKLIKFLRAVFDSVDFVSIWDTVK